MNVNVQRRNIPEKLKALTSLRFFAAALIVLYHSFETFHFGKTFKSFFPTYQAVSFFFILSGFILTYVYRDFDYPGSLRSFFLARFARIWPLHCVTLVLTIFIFSDWYWHQITESCSLQTFWLPLISNIFLVQSWIPLKEFFFSFNSVSWSISTEFGFYLLFPLLLVRVRYGWPLKLLLTLVISVSVVCLLYVFEIKNILTIMELVGSNPFARLLEFSVGMFTASLYDRVKFFYEPGKIVATVVEMVTLTLVLVGMVMSLKWANAVTPYLGVPARAWFAVGNSNVVFVALFILVMALARGGISEFLSKPVFVFLGEISFSVYLFHQILIRAYSAYFEKFILAPIWVVYCYFIVLTFFGSYLLWEIVEKPFRRLILTWGENGSLIRLKNDIFNQRVGLIFLTLFFLLTPIIGLNSTAPGITILRATQVESLLVNSLEGCNNVSFGTKFRLKGALLNVENKPSLRLIWESLGFARLKYRVAVHFIDKQGKIIFQADYNQSKRKDHKGFVRKGTFWVDTIDLVDIPKNIQTIGIALFTDNNMNLLPISGGSRDWNNTRLLIPFSWSL
jgi:peptidoglycan/LPS O-acetylase OafA/YrhL